MLRREQCKKDHRGSNNQQGDGPEAKHEPAPDRPCRERDGGAADLNVRRERWETKESLNERRSKNDQNTESDQQPETLCLVRCGYSLEEVRRIHEA